MHRDIDRILIPQEKIAARVRELAREITADHTPPNMAGEPEITIVPILTGAMIFCCDLIRHIPIAMKIGLMTVSSYPGSSIRTQGSQLLGQQLGDVRGRHVLLIDDILDSGGTLKLVVPLVQGARRGDGEDVRAAAQGPPGRARDRRSITSASRSPTSSSSATGWITTTTTATCRTS